VQHSNDTYPDTAVLTKHKVRFYSERLITIGALGHGSSKRTIGYFRVRKGEINAGSFPPCKDLDFIVRPVLSVGTKWRLCEDEKRNGTWEVKASCYSFVTKNRKGLPRSHFRLSHRYASSGSSSLVRLQKLFAKECRENAIGNRWGRKGSRN
jgi:hypothetical protein